MGYKILYYMGEVRTRDKSGRDINQHMMCHESQGLDRISGE